MTTISLLGGFGVEDKDNELREVPDLSYMFSCSKSEPKRKSTGQNQENPINLSNKFR
jgi:hypothetical protein